MTSASGEKQSRTGLETPRALDEDYEPSTENINTNVSNSSPGQDWRNEESPDTVDRPHSFSDPTYEIVITTIRVTDAALGLGRLPAGFYVVVHHGDFEWRTENKRSSVDPDVVEWGGPIPIPMDPSATIRLEIYGSFEFQPVLGAGEQLRKLTITIEELLDHSANNVPFTFFPKDGDVVSPCSSISVTVERRSSQRGGSSFSPHRLTTKSQGKLEEATNRGHSALSHYRKYGGRHNLEQSMRHFEHALMICPLDHSCRAVVQSNLATAKFLHCQAENPDTSLELPLRLYRDALAARPMGHLDRPSTLIRLATVHLVQFQKRGNNTVGEEQVEALLHEAMELSSTETHENRTAIFMLQLHAGHRIGSLQSNTQYLREQDSASRIMNEDLWILSERLLERFQRFGDLADLQQAIALLERLVRSTPPRDDRYCAGLDTFGVALMERFNHLGSLGDIDAAIFVLRDVVGLTHGQPSEPQHLHNLGTALFARFRRLGEPSDLEGAISSFRDAVDLTPSGHPRKRIHLNNLGTSIFFHFTQFGELTALEDAIARQREAVDLTPHGHPERPGYLINLGNSLRIRFEQLGELSDLENATSMLRNAVNFTPDDHPERPGRLNNLGTSLVTCFEHHGRIGDLDDAISILKEAVNLAPEGHPDKLICLNSLGNTLRNRFIHLGQISDLVDAISRQMDAVDLAPDGHPNKPNYLSSLGSSFAFRFKRLGELSDLENAILMQNKGVSLTPDGHPNKPSYLHNLGVSFAMRFQRLRQSSDLENAISRQMDAVNLTPHGHPDKHRYLNTLGTTFSIRFKLLGELNDIKDGMSMLSDAIDLIPHSHPDKSLYLNNLGRSFVACFEYFGELTDLEHAISRQKDAVDLVPRGHPERPDYLSGLGTSLKLRFKCLRELRDLEHAISREMDAIELTPHGHPHKPIFLDNLGTSFRTRFECLRELINLEQAISLHSHAALAPIGPINARFRASLNWVSCARHIRHHSLLHAYSISVGLLPQLAWIGLPLTQRYSEIMGGADVVRDAAAAALEAGLPETAVEWLEQGRSIVWGELLQLRSSHAELSSAYPDHARRLQELSIALGIASVTHEKSLSALSEQAQDVAHKLTDPQQVADEHRMLAIERDKLLQEVRRFPGFEGFLRHKMFSSLRASAHSGPVVILNAAESRCDALIVLAEVDRIIHVPLPNFSFQRADSVWNTMKSFVRYIRDGKRVSEDAVGWEHVLPPLWISIVKPVLDALAVLIPGDLSRIFWCPTGLFVFLPIHAAGLYDRQFSEPGNRVFDFVVSSYVPTLAILTPSSSPSKVPNSGNLRILAVPQPPSDGQARLPGVVTELNHIMTVINNSPSARTTFLKSSTGTVEEVISLMKHADWVHFACHGVQDGVDSGLCLANGHRLKLRDIIALSRPRGGLAFLSACQTATGEKHLSDEAIHIAAGMLFAGYEGVVGTMWSISDRLAPIVARDVYEYLFRNGTRPDYREAARALHEAITGLRDSGEASFAEWVPFIHVGL